MLDEVLLDSKQTFVKEQEEETRRCLELVTEYEEISVITEMIDVSCEIYERSMRKKRMYGTIVGEDSSSKQTNESLSQKKKARFDNTEK